MVRATQVFQKFIFKLLSINDYQLTIYALNITSFSRPGGDYEFEDYPSPLHIERHMSKCLLNHNFGSSHSSPQGSRKSSSRKSSSNSNSVEVPDPIDIIEREESRSPSVEEILERPGDFLDVFLRSLQEPDFLPNAPTGNEVFVEELPQIIQIFIEDQPSTNGGKQHNQKPTGRPEACLKWKSNENQPGSSPKKQKIHNIGKSNL